MNVLPGNADGMIEAEIPSDVDQLGDGATGSDNAEGGQHDVPADERSSEFVARPIGHQLLASENDQHVNADIVETARPVPVEPNLGVRVLEFVLELEDVRIIRHRHQVVHFAVGCARSSRRSDRVCHVIQSYFQHNFLLPFFSPLCSRLFF